MRKKLACFFSGVLLLATMLVNCVPAFAEEANDCVNYTDGKATALYDGYYAVAVNEGSVWFISGNDEISNTESTYPKVGAFCRYNKGDEISELTSDKEKDAIVYYSEDGGSVKYTQNLKLTASTNSSDEDLNYLYPIMAASVVSSNSDKTTFNVDVKLSDKAIAEGVKLKNFLVCKKGTDIAVNDKTIYWDKDATSANFNFDMTSNGNYTITVWNTKNVGYHYDITVAGIKGSSSASIDPVKQDTTAPDLTWSYSGGATDGEETKVSIRTNEKCNINVAGTTFADTDSVEYAIHGNCNLTVVATDMAGNVTTKNIEITSYVPVDNSSDYSYNDAERDSFWGVDSGSGSSLSVLPQTGSAGWYVMLGVACVAILGGAIFLTVKRKKDRQNSKEDASNESK